MRVPPTVNGLDLRVARDEHGHVRGIGARVRELQLYLQGYRPVQLHHGLLPRLNGVIASPGAFEYDALSQATRATPRLAREDEELRECVFDVGQHGVRRLMTRASGVRRGNRRRSRRSASDTA